MRDGRRTGPPDSLGEAHARLPADLAALPEDALRIRAPRPAGARVFGRLSGPAARRRTRLTASAGAAVRVPAAWKGAEQRR